MVGNLNSGNGDNGGDQNRDNPLIVGTRLRAQHNVEPEIIRGFIQRALTPLPVDPVPDWVLIKDIKIVREASGDLAISCAVLYGSLN